MQDVRSWQWALNAAPFTVITENVPQRPQMPLGDGTMPGEKPW